MEYYVEDGLICSVFVEKFIRIILQRYTHSKLHINIKHLLYDTNII